MRADTLYGFYEARGQNLQVLINGEPIQRSAASAYFDALQAHDDQAAEHQRVLDENAELRCRVQELEAENAALDERIGDWEWERRPLDEREPVSADD